MRVDVALDAARRAGRPALVPYILVDRARPVGRLVDELRRAGATAVELGFPFSDPIADGPTLEAACDRALAHGTRWSDLLRAARRTVPILPTAVMTYANPVWRRGLARALEELAGAGVSAMIVPDLSLEESGPWRRAATAHGVDLVLLAAPGAGVPRTVRIARRSRGFLYLVARYGTTGAGARATAGELGGLVRAAHGAAPRLPVLVGFGIRDRASARTALATGADGVIVGSALEERLVDRESLPRIGSWLASLVPTVTTRTAAR